MSLAGKKLGDDPAMHRSDCDTARRCGNIKRGRLIERRRMRMIVTLKLHTWSGQTDGLGQLAAVVMRQMIIVIDGDLLLIVLLVFAGITGVGCMLMMPPMTRLRLAFMQAQLGGQTPSALDWQHQH